MEEHKLRLTKVIHVLDDFLVLAESKQKCERDLRAFMNMCKQLLGVPSAPREREWALVQLSSLWVLHLIL